MNMLCKRKINFIKQMQQQANSSLHNTLAKIWGFQAIQRAILSSNYVNFSKLNRIPIFCAASPFASNHFVRRKWAFLPVYRHKSIQLFTYLWSTKTPSPPLLHVLLPLLAALWHHSSCGGEGGSGSIKYPSGIRRAWEHGALPAPKTTSKRP